MKIDENRFFREITLRVCGSLEIEKALWRCFLYIRDIIPLNELIFTVYDAPAGALEVVATADDRGGVARSDKITMPARFRGQLEDPVKFPRVRVSGEAGADSFRSRLAPNQRALLVPSGLAKAAGGAVRAGDRVDVVFVANEQKTGVGFSRTIGRGLEVLDVRDERGMSAKPGSDEAMPMGVILAVTEDEARLITLAAENGQLYLAIDGYEPRWTDDRGATMDDLAGGP